MAAYLTILTHIIAIKLHVVAESCTICGSRSRRPVRKLLDTPSYDLYANIDRYEPQRRIQVCDVLWKYSAVNEVVKAVHIHTMLQPFFSL